MPGRALVWSSSERCLARGLKRGTRRSVTLAGTRALLGQELRRRLQLLSRHPPATGFACPGRSNTRFPARRCSQGGAPLFCSFAARPGVLGGGERVRWHLAAHLRTTEECVPCAQGTSQGESMFQELPPPLQRLRLSPSRAGSSPGSSSPGEGWLAWGLWLPALAGGTRQSTAGGALGMLQLSTRRAKLRSA